MIPVFGTLVYGNACRRPGKTCDHITVRSGRTTHLLGPSSRRLSHRQQRSALPTYRQPCLPTERVWRYTTSEFQSRFNPESGPTSLREMSQLYDGDAFWFVAPFSITPPQTHAISRNLAPLPYFKVVFCRCSAEGSWVSIFLALSSS